MADLTALAVTPGAMARWLRRLWDDGDAVLPLDPGAPAGELTATLERLRPVRVGRAGSDGRVRFEPLERAHGVPDGTALVVATSGSTGRPRGVRLSHAAVRASTRASVERLGCGAGQPWLACLPTHHVAGLQALLRSWEAGAEPVVLDRFDVAAVASAPAPHVSLVPTQLRRLLDAGVDVARFATILLGGARAPHDLLARAHDAGARVVVSYGMTETCGGCVYDGVPLEGVEVALDAEGRIRLRGPVLFDGYHAPGDAVGATASEAPPDWFTTSDVGRWVEGRLEVLGRVDDVIVSGGENVPLDAVVDALLTHPGVVDAAATGREDDVWGEVVVAAVVPRDAARPPALGDLRDHVRRRHPAAFAPAEVTMVEAIPRGPLGKVPRAVLQGLLVRR